MKFLKNSFAIAFFCILFSNTLASQPNGFQNTSSFDRWYFGGHVSFNHGRSFTMGELAPAAGYFFSESLLVGVNAYYIYYGSEGEFENYRYKSESNFVGTGLFSRYYFQNEKVDFFNRLFAHAEYEYLLGDEKYIENDEPAEILEFDNHSISAGLGCQHNFNEKVGISATILWNISLSNSNYSPYQNPIVRIGFEF